MEGGRIARLGSVVCMFWLGLAREMDGLLDLGLSHQSIYGCFKHCNAHCSVLQRNSDGGSLSSLP